MVWRDGGDKGGSTCGTDGERRRKIFRERRKLPVLVIVLDNLDYY